MMMRSKYVVPRARMVYTGSKSVAELKQAVISAQADNDNNKQEEK